MKSLSIFRRLFQKRRMRNNTMALDKYSIAKFNKLNTARSISNLELRIVDRNKDGEKVCPKLLKAHRKAIRQSILLCTGAMTALKGVGYYTNSENYLMRERVHIFQVEFFNEISFNSLERVFQVYTEYLKGCQQETGLISINGTSVLISI